MGVSVRTDAGRYTEWRDWKSGTLVGREFYVAADEPAETHNRIDDSRYAEAQAAAERALRAQFPPR